MVKIIALIRRKNGISREEFSRHWFERHGPLASRLIPGLVKYVQNHPAGASLPGLQSDLDGIAELWFADVEAVKKYRAWRNTEAAKELLEDEESFIDIPTNTRFLAEERLIK